MNIHKVLESMYPGINVWADVLIADSGAGPYVAEWRRPEPQPTMKEIEAAWPAVQAALAQAAAEKQAADDQQRAGIDEAKRAYARLQTIIDNADTATTVQMRAAIKEIARDVQHLIRAAVR